MYNRLQSANSIDEVSYCGLTSFVYKNNVYAFFFFVFFCPAGWGGGCLKSDIFYLKQVIQHHDFFLDKCLRECLLLLPELLKVSFCLLFVLPFSYYFLFFTLMVIQLLLKRITFPQGDFEVKNIS